ncbi:MAG: AAA family ATPase [Candidatus Nomurabacteria bacterium]|nr:AAA family ATPase [Candidatus Nomurabacteria bacterium]
MPVYIKSIKLKEFEGALDQTLNFEDGLNIISGENGTGKTTALRKIKEYANNNNPDLVLFSDNPAITQLNQLGVYALSPKRNSEKKTVESIFSILRSTSKTMDIQLEQQKNRAINDNTFEAYPSFGELFILYFDEKCKDGGEQIAKMNEVTTEFNELIQKVFPEYSFVSNWDNISGKPDIKLKISNRSALSLEKLSCGQQEVLSLIFNIYTSKGKYQIYLIDEPEIHLNWNLEKGLFQFLDWFCINHNKQIITVTHSRTIFEEQFYAKAKFLVWDDLTIKYQSDISGAQREAIVGELAATINIVAPTSKTFFVEDKMHEFVIDTLAQKLGKTVSTVKCGNSPNVKSFYGLSKDKSSAWRENGYYVIDGDNEGNPFPGESRFIHLNKYSIDSYLFNLDLLSEVVGKTIEIIQKEILSVMQTKKLNIFSKGKNAKFGHALIDKMTFDYITEVHLSLLDCTEILEGFAQLQNKSSQDLFAEYIEKANQKGILSNIFDLELINAINA